MRSPVASLAKDGAFYAIWSSIRMCVPSSKSSLAQSRTPTEAIPSQDISVVLFLRSASTARRRGTPRRGAVDTNHPRARSSMPSSYLLCGTGTYLAYLYLIDYLLQLRDCADLAPSMLQIRSPSIATRELRVNEHATNGGERRPWAPRRLSALSTKMSRNGIALRDRGRVGTIMSRYSVRTIIHDSRWHDVSGAAFICCAGTQV
ncbi:hypothetical protein C8T65DRAFT_59660 [Cerioporus squamosus]|nr:hypothetical protein C8T65DRAFT_59660 [Cerioporus squamosus]